MKVLLFSTDVRAFDTESAVRARLLRYTELFEELQVLVIARGGPSAPVLFGTHGTLYPVHAGSRLGMLLSAYRIGVRVLMRSSSDTVISTQDPFWTGLIGFLLAQRFHAPLQLQVHTDFLSPFFISGPRSFLERLLARFLLPRAACVRVVSERISRSLVERGYVPKERITVLPIVSPEEGVPAEEGRDASEEATAFPRILMASRLEGEKDVSLGIRVFARLRERFPNAVLLIAGVGSKEKQLRQYAETLKLGESVRFLGWREPASVMKLLHEADMFLLTSRFEGFALSLVEAARAGCPIVTTDVGIANDILTESSACICPVGDEACLAGALTTLSNDADLRGKLLRQAKQAIQERLPANEEAYFKAYRDCLAACHHA